MKIIFICSGNTCRSPIAEGYLKSLGIPCLDVLSRGIFADGSYASYNSALVMSEIGIDISAHKSKNLSSTDMDADLFVCMTKQHSDILLSAGIKNERITVLSNGIPDPYGQGTEKYRYCRDKIINAVNSLVFDGLLGIKICEAEKNDAADIAKLEALTSSEPWSKQAIIDSMNASTLFYKAEIDSKLIGYIGMSVAADECYITNIAVFEKYRKRSVATLLLNYAILNAKLQNVAFISLEVRKSNENAIRLYEKLQFKVEGLRKSFYRKPIEDAIIYTRRF